MLEFIGKTFHRLTVIGVITTKHRKNGGRFRLRCECGNEIVRTSSVVLTGNTKSCGCLKLDRIKALRRSHGKSKTPEYVAWCAMKERCRPDTTEINRKSYADRGIMICDRWLNSFENFLEDMGLKPTPKHEVDRIDNDADYGPENCRWATRTQQNRNKRNSRFITANGKTQTLAAWVEETGIAQRTIWDRLERGWPDEKAVTTPVLKTWANTSRENWKSVEAATA